MQKTETYVKERGAAVPKALPVLDVSRPVRCAPIAAKPMTEKAALEVALRLKALADPVRLRLLSLILAAPDDGLCNCDLAPTVGLSDATVSHHLKALREAGLVVGDKRGTWVYYRPVRPALGALCRVIDPDCC